jgi:transposase
VESGVRESRVWKRLLGVEATVVEGVDLDPVSDAVVVSVRPDRRFVSRCGRCRTPSPGYDRGVRRRWRALDAGTVLVWLEADATRVCCPVHGVTVAAVPWARHRAGHTYGFDQTVAWLATRCAKTTVAALLRVSWRTVGAIVTRVVADLDAAPGRPGWGGLTRIGIDEVSYRRGHKYLTVVVDHDSGRMLWAKDGRTKKTLAEFFDLLGEAGCRGLQLVSSDGADWIADLVALRAPKAKQCMDPFHVVTWAQKAMDQVRIATSRALSRAGDKPTSTAVFRSRHTLWKKPDKLTAKQQATLDAILTGHAELATAWRLKEGLRAVVTCREAELAGPLLQDWHTRAAASGLAPFTKLEAKLARFDRDILHAVTHRLTNARSEATNLHIRFLTRIAYGFHSPDALLALAKLRVGGYHVPLPGRT